MFEAWRAHRIRRWFIVELARILTFRNFGEHAAGMAVSNISNTKRGREGEREREEIVAAAGAQNAFCRL